jgi:hypothetical protein
MPMKPPPLPKRLPLFAEGFVPAPRAMLGKAWWVVLIVAWMGLVGFTWSRPIARASFAEVGSGDRIGFRLDLNSAERDRLTALPGIGEGLASRIVEDRQRRGRFEDAADLRRVRGIGVQTAARIEPWVRFGRLED